MSHYYYSIYVGGVWVLCPDEVNDNTMPPTSRDDVLDGHQILESAKTLSDIFGDGWGNRVPA